jgi:hypothetical protein
VFPVRYELNYCIVFRRNSVFEGLIEYLDKSSVILNCWNCGSRWIYNCSLFPVF